MIKVKSRREIEIMTEAGKRLAQIFSLLSSLVKADVVTFELDQKIEGLLHQFGLKGVCKGYGGYPSVSCISINQGIVHGIPSKKVVLKAGDFVKLDLVGSLNGYCVDMARGFFVPPVEQAAIALDEAAKKAFFAGIAVIKPGVRLSTVSYAIEQSVLESGFFVVREFAGHGIGKKIHEEPEIPNFGAPDTGPILREGMMLAIEPMITQTLCKTVILQDGWTAVTSNGCLAAHFENTVVVTKTGVAILTE